MTVIGWSYPVEERGSNPMHWGEKEGQFLPTGCVTTVQPANLLYTVKYPGGSKIRVRSGETLGGDHPRNPLTCAWCLS